ncbi:hypothetical protein CR513_15910, partial [Mucuna pruriens]
MSVHDLILLIIMFRIVSNIIMLVISSLEMVLMFLLIMMLKKNKRYDSPEAPPVQLRRSNRERQSSTRYTSDEYMEQNLNFTRSPWRVKRDKSIDNLNCRSVLLCPLSRQSLNLFKMNIVYSMIVRVQFILHINVRYHCIRDALDVKLLEFKACCEIIGLAITSI